MTRYLPEAKLAPGVDRNSITVHDLIALTHGLAGDGPVVIRTAYSGEFTRAQLLDLLQHHAATGAHGTFSYNNLGFNLAGLVLESAYDEPWQDIVHRLVIEPIGMHDTNARVSRMDRGLLAQPHAGTPHGWTTAPLGKEDANMHAAGGHFASARDMARYLAVHIGEGTIDGERVLPAEAIRATHQMRATQNRRFGPYQRFGWAYGWDLGTYGSDTLIHRFGGFTGYRSHVSFMPQHDVGVVVLVNGEGPASAASDLLATHIYDLLLNKPGVRESFGARLDSLTSQLAGYRTGLANHLAERRARLAPLPHPLEHYAGTYTNPLLGTMVWRVVAGGLEVRVGVQQSRAEVYNAADNALRIEVGGGGQVAQFIFPQDGGPARALRLADQEFVRAPAGR
jgi:CubicO group peptidase (beta-lactamase class C family)